MLKIQAKHSKVDIVVEADKISFDHLMIDKLRVQQVLINLLTNAIKFTKSSGSVKVIVEVIP